MMDLGPNGDKRKIYQLRNKNWNYSKTGSYKLDNPVWHSLRKPQRIWNNL
jgi:hypothetical protein